MDTRLFPALVATLLLASNASATTGAGRPWAMPEIAGVMTDARLAETSGLAASRSRPGAFWTHNDSDRDAELHLMSASGQRLASVGIEGVQNTDWEDLAAFSLDGRRYLLIADTGDNGGLRQTLRLIVVEEPTTVTDGMRIRPAWVLPFRWPDGPRDCEAVAVDAAAGEVLLISKKRVPPELLRVGLRAAPGEVQVARKLGLLRGIHQPTPEQIERSPLYGRYRAQITAADLSPDGRTLAVLNYQAVYLFRREPAARWATALRQPQRLEFAWMPQAEALAFSADGTELWVAGEQRPSPLIRFRQVTP